MVPSADSRRPTAVFRSQRFRSRSTAAVGRNRGRVESDQMGTVGTQPARLVAIAPRCLRYRKNDRSAGILPMRIVREPGTQGAGIAGTQGMGVSTPNAAAVAAITCGLESAPNLSPGLRSIWGRCGLQSIYPE